MATGQRVSDQTGIGPSQEGLLVGGIEAGLPINPCADVGEPSEVVQIEECLVRLRPCAGVGVLKFASDGFDAQYLAASALPEQPIPEGGANCKCVVTILCLQNRVGIKDERYASPPVRYRSFRPSNTDVFLVPSSSKASLKSVLPSSVLAITSRMNRFPSLTLAVL